MKKTLIASSLALTLATVTLTASALGNGSTDAQSGTAMAPAMKGTSKADQDFVKNAAIGGMAEVQAGQLAQQKGNSEQVRQFGQQMVADHGKANDELKQIAASKSLEVPAMLDKAHQKDADKLQKLSGADFDKQYMKDMVADHKKTIDLFTKESKSAKDPDLKAFADKTMPTLQMHLKMAQDTSSSAKQEK